jgi:hypothetical protein
MMAPIAKGASTLKGPGFSTLPPLDYMPGEVVIRVKPEILHTALGAAKMGFTVASAAMLPGIVAEPISYLERNLGLTEAVPVFSSRQAALWRAPLQAAQKTRLALLSSAAHAPAPELGGIAILKIDPAQPVLGAVKFLRNQSPFEYVEPVPARYIGGEPSAEPLSPAARQWALRAIRWFQASRPDAGEIRVAVLDTGVDRSHPDLCEVVGGDYFRGLKSEDIVGHGTHVAGILAAVANSAGSVANCKLDVWKIFSDTPASDGRHVDHTAYLKALSDVLKSRARIVNLSISGTKLYVTEQRLIERLLDQGATVVAAMGNAAEDGNPISYPATYDHVFAIGAIGSDMRRASFSNTGKHILLAAPGVNVLSTVPHKPSRARPETDYANWDGTSMAAPHVTGSAALFFSQSPAASRDDLRAKLAAAAQKLSAMKSKAWTGELGYGVLNLEGLLAK